MPPPSPELLPCWMVSPEMLADTRPFTIKIWFALLPSIATRFTPDVLIVWFVLIVIGPLVRVIVCETLNTVGSNVTVVPAGAYCAAQRKLSGPVSLVFLTTELYGNSNAPTSHCGLLRAIPRWSVETGEAGEGRAQLPLRMAGLDDPRD